MDIHLLVFLNLLLVSFVNCQEAPRIDCHPEPGATEQACKARMCKWDSNTTVTNAPYCYFLNTTGYTLNNFTSGKYVLSKNVTITNPKNPYGADISPLNVNIINYGAIVNIRIFDPTKERYEPPVNLPKASANSSETLTIITSSEINKLFTFKVQRNNSTSVIWDTSIGGLLFADQYIQIATLLPTENIYGFGEHVHKQLKHDFNRYTTWPMFARDDGPDSRANLSTKNLYGVHPFYLGVEDGGKAHGVLILNSNAQEVTLGPGPSLVYRTIGGILDIYFFPGPTPDDVISQYLGFIGKPFLPAYWALGFQLCRWGYTGLDDMKAAVNRTQSKQIPLDVPYADIDYMSRYKDFTEGWKGFDDYVRQLQAEGLHVILIFDPAIEADYESFNRSETFNVSYVDWPSHDFVPRQIEDNYTMIRDKNIMLGNVWPDANAAFPDFLDIQNNTLSWWTNEFVNFHKKCPFNGIWIDMNEPSNFDTTVYNRTLGATPPTENFHLSCPVGSGYPLDDPPYSTWGVYVRSNLEHLSSKTLCMIGVTSRNTTRFYDTKSLYGWAESRATYSALKAMNGGKRAAIISRSTFVSSGRYAGHWLGDNTASWDDLLTSIIGTIEFNMFGIPYVGSDICGFNGNTTEELCLRWHQLGAFYPFSRNHNSKDTIPQDPAQWPSVTMAAREALLLRYKLLPYLYSLLYGANLYGRMVVRPLFFSYPNDKLALNNFNQFMWGDSLLFAPILEQNVTGRNVYFPPGFWYSIRSNDYGQLFTNNNNSTEGVNKLINAPRDWNIPVYLLGGKIVPTQVPAMTTTLSRNNSFGLIIALGTWTEATGEMYWDDGENDDGSYYWWIFEFNTTSTKSVLKITKRNATKTPLVLPTLDIIDILGYDRCIDTSSIVVDEVSKPIDPSAVTVNLTNKYVKMNVPNFLSLTEKDSLTLTWQNMNCSYISSTPMPTKWSTSSTLMTSTTNDSNTIMEKHLMLMICLIEFVIFFSLNNQ